MYIKRNIEESILKSSKNYPVILVCGQRQVGKSTTLIHIKEDNRKYVSLDNRNARKLAEEDPYLFIETYGLPIIIDEIQKVPSLFETIKEIVDKKTYAGEECNGLFWLSGSQKFHMMKGVSESLAGRVAIFEMSGLSNREKEGFDNQLISFDIDDLENRQYKKEDIGQIYKKIFEGGMPKIIAENIDREKYYDDYISTYLERDIRELSQVGKTNEFYDFLIYIASRTGQAIKYEDASKQIGISSATVKNRISILEQSGIIFILRAFSSNLTKRLVKTSKVYFMDTGLAAHLCRWLTPETLMNGNMSGAFLETYVVSEIVKSYINNGRNLKDLYYYRDFDQKEIDLLSVGADFIVPIEIKKNKDPIKPDRNFNLISKFRMNVKTGIVLCMADEIIPINRNCYLVPISKI